MTNNEIAKTFHDTARDLQMKRITVDEARARNAALRTKVGDDAYDRAKGFAVASLVRNA